MAFEVENGILTKFVPEDEFGEFVIPEGVTEIPALTNLNCKRIVLPSSLNNIGKCIEDNKFMICEGGCTSVFRFNDDGEEEQKDIIYVSVGFSNVVLFGVNINITDFIKSNLNEYNDDDIIEYLDDDSAYLYSVDANVYGTFERRIINEIIDDINHVLQRDVSYEYKQLPNHLVLEIFTQMRKTFPYDPIVQEMNDKINSYKDISELYWTLYEGDNKVLEFDGSFLFIPSDFNDSFSGPLTGLSFMNSESLVAFKVDDENPDYCSKDGLLYSKDMKKLICVPNAYSGEILIPNGVNTIGSYAFLNCDNVTSVVLPDTVKEIESGAFRQCSKLSNISIPNSVTSIKPYSFLDSLWFDSNEDEFFIVNNILLEYKGNKSDVEIPDNVIRIAEQAFYEMQNIKSVKMSDNVTEIGDFAFSGCINLSEIKFSKNIKSIGSSAFENTYWLNNSDGYVIVNRILIAYNGTEERLNIPDTVVRIESQAFLDNNVCTFIKMPESLKQIGPNAFRNCAKLETVIFEKGFELIGPGAFIQCPIKQISLPETVSEIADNAFGYCTELRSINIPDKVKTLGIGVFVKCGKLSEIILGPNSHFVLSEGALWTKDMQTKIVELAK